MIAETIPNVQLLDITDEPEKKIVQIAHLSRQENYESDIDETEVKKFFDIWINEYHHDSVLEHAHATFLIEGGSRSFTHQIVRHRIASYLQQSQRAISYENNLTYIIPPDIAKDADKKNEYDKMMKTFQKSYSSFINKNVTKEDARFILPNAIESKIIITTNFREYRHMIKLRGSKAAQWEIRKIIIEMWKILIEHAPNIFGIFKIQKEGSESYLINKLEVTPL